MRKAHLIALVALGGGLLAGAGYGWHRWRVQLRAALVRAALPAVPDLSGWPRPYAARVREATAAAGRPEQAVAALGELALLYHANNSYQEAAQAERALLALDPKNGRWTYFLADACEKLGDAEGQRTYLERTAELTPYYATARIRLADLLLKLGRPEEARAHYERYLALVPNEPHGRLGLARIALERGDRNGAIKILDGLIRDHPDFAAGHNLLAEVLAAAGATAQADEQRRLSGATGEGQKVDDPWLDRLYAWSFDSFRIELAGGTEAQAKIVAASLPFYEQAVRLAPGDALAYDALGGLDQQLNRLDEAAAVLAKGIARRPRTAALYDTLAQVRRQQGRETDALEVLQRGIRANPAAAVLRCDLGSVLEKAGRREDAVAAYREAVRLDPGLGEAHWDLGLCLLAAGEITAARASLGRALALQPRGADALVALAQKSLASGQLEQAAGCIHVVIENSPGTPVRALVEQALAQAQKSGDEKAGRDFAQLLAQPLP